MALDDELVPNEEGEITVDLGEPQVAPADFGSDDAPNLVPVFMGTDEGKRALQTISADVLRKFNSDWESSENYRQRVADDHRILYGDLTPKTFPWKDCANAHVPSTLEKITRIVARVDAEVFGDWTNVFGVLPVGAAGEDFAQTLAAHGNWQIREKLDDFPRQIALGELMFYMDGDVTNHAYWDPVRRLPVLEMLTPDEFVTPYTFRTMRPDYSDLPHYTKVFRKYRHELEAMVGEWFDVDKVIDNRTPSFDDEPDETMRSAREQMEGIDKPEDESDAPYKLLHHEGWMLLPGRDRQRWCQAIVDPVSRAILCLTIHEEENWQDKIRFERQTAELQTYQAMLGQHLQAKDMFQSALDTHAQAMEHGMGPVQSQIAGQQLQAMQMQIPPEPPPPAWMKPGQLAPEPIRKDPIYMFAHGVCVESMVGNLGLSYGRILADLNRAQNVALNQFIDAATLANGGILLTTDAFEEDSPIEWGPGKVVRVPGIAPGQIAGNIQALSFPPANQQLLEAVKAFDSMGESALQAPAVLSGEPGKSGETYRGISSRIEQATKQLSVSARNFCRFLKQILRNLAKLNAVYLDDDEIAMVVQQGVPTAVRATKEMYARNYQITINADLRFASQTQRIAEADEIVSMCFTPGSPLSVNPLFQYQAIVKAFIARGRQDLIPYLGPPPPPAPMFGIPPPVPPQFAPPPGAVPPGQNGPQKPAGGPPQGEQPAGEQGQQTPPPGSGPPPHAPSPPRAPSPPQPAGPPG